MGKKTVVWEAPADGPYSKEVWAPELHFVEGKWRIYFAFRRWAEQESSRLRSNRRR